MKKLYFIDIMICKVSKTFKKPYYQIEVEHDEGDKELNKEFRCERYDDIPALMIDVAKYIRDNKKQIFREN